MIEKIEKPVTPLELNSKINEIIDNIAGKSIGEIISVACGSGYVPEGCLPCDGAEYSKTQFTDLWTNYLTSTENDYTISSAVTVNGTPTINNGVASGFSANNYISIPSDTVIANGGLVLKCKTPSTMPTNIEYYSTYCKLDSSYLIYPDSADPGHRGTLEIGTDTVFYVKFLAFTQNPENSDELIFNYQVSLDGETWYGDVNLYNYGYYANGLSIGKDNYWSTTTNPFSGSIDLAGSYFINWSTGAKTYLCETKPKTLLNTCTYEDYATDFETYGQCGMFAIDSENEKFRVPLIKDGAVIQQALSDSELGKSYNAGLPNATGIIAVTSGSSTDVQFLVDDSDDIEQEGALYVSRSRTSYGIGKTSASHSQPADISLDLSRSDSIYGNSQTVQPNAITLRYFVVVANGQINQSQMDWSAWASGLQNKLNKDHSNDEKPYITEVSDSSLLPSWYRVWSDGWCEQGGRSSDNVASTTISFLLEFNDTNYTITTSDTRAATTNSHTGGASYGAYIGSYTTKSFYLSLGKGDQKYAEWRACGYVKIQNV